MLAEATQYFGSFPPLSPTLFLIYKGACLYAAFVFFTWHIHKSKFKSDVETKTKTYTTIKPRIFH